MHGLRPGIRIVLQRPQRHLHSSLKAFPGSCRDGVGREWRQSVLDKFNGLANHVGKARRKTWML
jgi:hypothetical protein